MKRYIRSEEEFDILDYLKEHPDPTPMEAYKDECTKILYEEFVDDGIILDDYTLDRYGNPINLNDVRFRVLDIRDGIYLEVYFVATYPKERPLHGIAYMHEDPSVGEPLGFDEDMYKIDFDKWGWK